MYHTVKLCLSYKGNYLNTLIFALYKDRLLDTQSHDMQVDGKAFFSKTHPMYFRDQDNFQVLYGDRN